MTQNVVLNHRSQQTVLATKVKTQTYQNDHVTFKQIMKPTVTVMSTASLQASSASTSLASNQVPDGILGKIVHCPIHVTCETASCSSSVHISLVSLKQRIIY